MPHESSEPFVFEYGVDPEREAEIERRLVAWNQRQAACWDRNHDGTFVAAPLQIFVVDDDNRLIGGLSGRTHAIRDWLEVLVLWVDENHHGRGIGRKLMAEAEEEARRRGCRFARLASSNYQAPGFYRSIGYNIYGQLEDCPPGDTACYLRKNLIARD